MVSVATAESPRPAAGSPYLQKPTSLLDATFELYGFLPEDGDPRWPFLERYDETRRQTRFRPINFVNAWGATYLSDAPSYRCGFVSSLSEENCLQLDRALDNLAHRGNVAERYAASQAGYGAFDMRLTLTDRLTNGPPERIETPCPEALFQIRLYYGRYLARIGFNVHNEAPEDVLSIVNIQGTRGGLKRNAEFEAEFGTSPFNLLVQRVLALAEARDPAYEVRGMINPARGNSQLYWGVLEHEKVTMYHAHRK